MPREETMSMAETAVREHAPEDQREYWLKKLSIEREHSGLIVDYKRAGGNVPQTESVEVALPVDLVHELDRVAANSPFLVYTVLLTALKICLHKYSGTNTIIVGSPARKKLGGLFQRPNALAIADEVTDDMSFRQLLSNVRETLLEAYAKQSYPYARLLQDLNIESDDQRCPLFEVALALKEIHSNLLEVKNDVTITFDRAGEQLIGVAEYDASLFRRESISGFMQSLVQVLGSGLRNTGASIAELSPLNEAERQRLLVEWNHAQILHPPDRCIHHLIEAQADAAPDALAVIFEEERLSYAELDARANQLARHLRGLGVGPDVPVGILVERSLEMVVGLIGILKAGGAYVPLDPLTPRERLAMIVADSGVEVLLTQSALAGTLSERANALVRLDTDWPEIESQSRERVESSAHSENLAYIIFTSGSTGRPKGVMVQHRSLVSRSLALVKSLGINSSDRLFQFVSLSFDASVQEIFLSLASGAALVLHRNPAESTTADLLRTCEQQGVTTLHLPPAFWHQVIDELSSTQHSIPKWLKLMLAGGESISMQKLATLAGLAEHPTRYINCYGPTEAACTATYYDTPLDAETLLRWARLPIGKPVDETQAYVLDHQQQPVPVGATGELYIGGHGVARGYINQPHQTAALFLPDPFSAQPGARLYRTGDQARFLPDGNLEFLGRRDAQVKVRGHRIELGEVESALLQHPRVSQCVVMPAEPAGGEGVEAGLIAYVVDDRAQAQGAPGDGVAGGTVEAELSVSELRQHLRARLPDYMSPAVFVLLERLPLMPNGKVDRRALSLIEASTGHSSARFAAPTTPVEEQLATIWREVLHCELVGVHDNFFELGGDSILSIQIMARATQAGLRLTPRDLFEHPTVAALAGVAEAAVAQDIASAKSVGGESNEIETTGQTLEAPERTLSSFPLANLEQDELDELIAKQHDVEDIYPLSPMQEAMLFHKLYAPGSELYFHQSSVRLEGKLDVPAFERAWQQIASRHQILRTSFVWEGLTHPMQVVHREARIPFEHQDWRELAEDEQQERLNSWLKQERTRGFDLTQAPLMRISLIRLTDDAYQFVWNQHHLLLDGWSGSLVLREVFAYYEAHRQGQALELPVPRAYRDYIHWLQQQDPARAERFWRSVLAGFTAPTPLGMEQPPGPSSDGPDYLQQYLELSTEATTALRLFARQNDLTLNTLVQGAWAFLLSRYSGRRDVVFGTVVSGRPVELEGIESMVGLFINTLPVRVQVSPEMEVLPWLQQLQRRQAEARQYQYSPLVQIRGWSEVPAGQPLFESHAVFQNNSHDADAEQPRMSLKAEKLTGVGEEHHPLVILAALDARLLFRLRYERRRFRSSTMVELLKQLELLMGQWLKQPHASLQAFEGILVEAERQQQADTESRLEQLSVSKLKNLKRKSSN
jgi:amino acid adenylation domain-containing protein